jgi:lysophospholipase L1-like esterase
MSTRRLLTTMALLAVLLTSACGGGSDDPKPAAKPSTTSAPARTPSGHPIKGISSYVALGDSYTSGPAIPTQEREAGLCFRSNHNYAALLARVLDVRSFKDVSCAGATTTNVLHSTAHPVRGGANALAQVSAVKTGTSLVTVGIGGNDSGLFGTLFQTCAQAANQSTDVCRPYITSKLPQILVQTRRAVAGTLEAVTARAPKARVVLIGYLRLAPTTKVCATFPVSAADLPVVAGAETQLDAAMSRAAEDAGVDYFSMREVSDGHDACAGASAWTNGASPRNGDGFPLHPNAAGMRAVASTIASELRRAS